ncbi:AGC/NDR protein kinase, variant 2 [Coprinopsis cinerea AmutBmut pab1-1]|nr:AGC/NDR protein kinase, variant 2 [Coprinopsis cinerea AmutBmut pab1-1]
MGPVRANKSTREARNHVEAGPTQRSPPQAPYEEKKEDGYVLVAAGKLGRVYKSAYDEERFEKPVPDPELVQPVSKRPPPLGLQDLEIIKALGDGAEGRVYLVRTTRSSHPLDRPGTLYAVKTQKKKYKRQALPPEAHMLEKDNERTALALMDWNPFIAGVIDILHDVKNIYTILELIPSGTLLSLIKSHAPMPPTIAAFYFANMFSAIEYVHALGLVHRDIKPDNFLLGEDGYLSLTDFGLTVPVDDFQVDWVDIGTPLYRPPEMDVRASPAQEKEGDEEEVDLDDRRSVDWYSSAVVLYEMVTRTVPFYGRTKLQTNALKVEKKYSFPKDIRIGSHFKDLIKSLLDPEPSNRPRPAEIQENKWLSRIDWDKLHEKQYLVRPPFSSPLSFFPMEYCHPY